MEGEIDPLWHLHDHLTVEQAAALIAGYDPPDVENCWGDSNFAQNHPKLYIAREALVNAIKKGKLKAGSSWVGRDAGNSDRSISVVNSHLYRVPLPICQHAGWFPSNHRSKIDQKTTKAKR